MEIPEGWRALEAGSKREEEYAWPKQPIEQWKQYGAARHKAVPLTAKLRFLVLQMNATNNFFKAFASKVDFLIKCTFR